MDHSPIRYSNLTYSLPFRWYSGADKSKDVHLAQKTEPWRNRSFFIYLCLFFGAVLSFCDVSSAEGLQKQGRWFTYNGQYVYLVGIGAQPLASDPLLDFAAILDQLKLYRINKIRIWLDAYWESEKYLHPWVYDSVAGKYDIDTWNKAYWRRVNAVVSAARIRNIIVEISIFNAYPSNPAWWSSDFRVAWNKEFNINGAFSSNLKGHFFPEFFDLNYDEKSISGKTLKEYQKALVDKAILELGSYPNVYFEVMNEFFEFAHDQTNGFETVAPWQQYWADYIQQHTSHLVSVHVHDATNSKALTHGVAYFWDRSGVDVLTFHLYKSDPGKISNYLHAYQNKGKIIQNNESFAWFTDHAVSQEKLDKVTREAWGWFVSGGYFAFYNGHHVEFSGWSQFALSAKALRDIAERVRFWEMSPIDDFGNEYDRLLAQGPAGPNKQLFANPGSEYIAYFWGKPTKTFSGKPKKTDVIIQLPEGNYNYQWYDPRNGKLLDSDIATGKGATRINSPSPSSWSDSAGLVLIVTKVHKGLSR